MSELDDTQYCTACESYASRIAELEAAIQKLLDARDKAASIVRSQQLQNDPDNMPPEFKQAQSEFGANLEALEELHGCKL